MMLSSGLANAQDMIKEDEQNFELGFYLSRKGIADNIYYGGFDISDDDVMPYPFLFFSFKYNKKYQVTIAWANDIYEDSKKQHNENIFISSARYNYYPFKEELYLFAGPSVWFFNKKYNFEQIITDRPDGRSTIFGINAGFGWDYNLSGLIFSHELEVYFAPCKYKDFICSGWDIKFLGVNFPL